jgi:hypothetical protein
MPSFHIPVLPAPARFTRDMLPGIPFFWCRAGAAMPVSEALMTSLLAFAVQLSGLPAIEPDDLPPVLQMTEDELATLVCPEEPNGCRTLAAVFDTEHYRILIQSSLSPEDPLDSSFLVHELVHVLQFKQFGDARFATCTDVLSSERQAYSVQNAYLREQGIFWREGRMLRYMQCPEESE